MRRRLAALAAMTFLASGFTAQAAPDDPIGDLIMSLVTASTPGTPSFNLKATLYHASAKGVGALDSLGCRVVAMRTAAVDPRLIPRRTVLFIEETVGMPMPGGERHNGYWYASDTGGAIKGERIDLYTGSGPASMRPMRRLSLARLSAIKVGRFNGCPPQ